MDQFLTLLRKLPSEQWAPGWFESGFGRCIDKGINCMLLCSLLSHSQDVASILLQAMPMHTHERLLRCATCRGCLDLSGTAFSPGVFTNMCRNILPRLSGIRELHLSGCCFPDSNLHDLAAGFAALQGLSSLNLSCNELEADQVKVLAPALAHLPDLELLDLFGSRLQECGTLAVLSVLKNVRSIRHLDLGCNGMSSASSVPWYNHLPQLCMLQRLVLGCNPTQPHRVSVFGMCKQRGREDGDATRRVRQDLRNYNRLGTALLLEMSPMLAACAQLKHLDLAGCSCGMQGGLALAHTLESLSAVTHLNMAHNALLDTGAAAICSALQGSAKIQWLDLSWNAISGNKCVPALARLSQLKHLNLRVNELQDKGALQLASCIHCSVSGNGDSRECLGSLLEELDVSYNDARHGTMGRVMQAAAALQGLRSLRVAGNAIADADALHSVSCMSELSYLGLLDLSWCRLGAPAKAELRRITMRVVGPACQVITEDHGPGGPDALVPVSKVAGCWNVVSQEVVL
jgi:Ran GTPase-activating protein (RanGAP) involved in mRNA processing and transport